MHLGHAKTTEQVEILYSGTKNIVLDGGPDPLWWGEFDAIFAVIPCVYTWCWQVNVLEPHPHLPVLATSGLDSDVKLWMSTASQPGNMSTLQRASDTKHIHIYGLPEL